MPRGTLPIEADLHLNIPILLFTLLATTLAGLLFGCAPAWYASRVDPGEALKEGGRSGIGAGRHRLRRALVIGEFALALALLAGAGLAIHSFLNLTPRRPRRPHRPRPHLLPSGPRFAPQRTRERSSPTTGRFSPASTPSPASSHATAMTGMPLYGAGFGMPFTIAGKPAFNDPSQRPDAGFGMVTPDFFQTFGIRLVNGRVFTEQDNASSVKVAVVNEEFVKKFFKDIDPLQQRISSSN